MCKKIIKAFGFICLGLICILFAGAFFLGFLEGFLGITIGETDFLTTTETTELINTITSTETTEIVTTPQTAPIRFSVLGYTQNYLGGNSIHVSIKNVTDVEIIGVQYTLAFYNFKGELLYDDIRWNCSSLMWTTGNIKPGETIEINGGTFYNSQFHGKYKILKIEIGYADGTLDFIDWQNLTEYEQFCFSDDEIYVWYGTYSACYHTEDCQYREINHANIQSTLTEARALEKSQCTFCIPN